MPTSEFEKKIHRWASLICCFGSYRCLVRVGSICNLLELDLQMPGQVWKHLQFVGYEFADTYPGVGSICNLLELDLQMPGRGRKHLQFAGIGFADAWSGSEASTICWNWICRCLAGVGSICNLRKLELQMPGRGWKHLQFAGIGFADAWSGSEASAICWNWICRCLVGGGSICNLLELDLQMHILGAEASATCWNWICRCLVRIGSICNLLVLELQMPGRGWKHPQLAGYEFADAYHQVDIKNPTTIAVGLFFMSKKEQNVLVDLRSILC